MEPCNTWRKSSKLLCWVNQWVEWHSAHLSYSAVVTWFHMNYHQLAAGVAESLGSIAQDCSNKPQKWSRAPLSVSCVLWLKLLRLLSYACPHFGFFSTNIIAKMLNYFLSQCWFCHWCNTANRVPAIWPSAKTKLFIVTEKLSIFIVIHKVCCQKPKHFHMRAARGYETDKYSLEQDERFHKTNKTTRVLTSFTPSKNI